MIDTLFSNSFRKYNKETSCLFPFKLRIGPSTRLLGSVLLRQVYFAPHDVDRVSYPDFPLPFLEQVPAEHRGVFVEFRIYTVTGKKKHSHFMYIKLYLSRSQS